MEYTIVIKKEPNAPWTVTAPTFPKCKVEAESKEAALDQVKDYLAQCYFEELRITLSEEELNERKPQPLSDEELVKRNHPGFGAFKDDPFFDEVWDDIERSRDELILVEGQLVEVTQTFGKAWWARTVWKPDCEVLALTREAALAEIEPMIAERWPLDTETIIEFETISVEPTAQ